MSQSHAKRRHAASTSYFMAATSTLGLIGRAVVDHAGYNKWADMNQLIVLYPQTVPTAATGTNPGNPLGCWDWWGFQSNLPRNYEFARKTGYQISAIKGMLDRLAQKFAQNPRFRYFRHASALLGTRQYINFSCAHLAAQQRGSGVSISIGPSTSSGTYSEKEQVVPVKGASFADRG